MKSRARFSNLALTWLTLLLLGTVSFAGNLISESEVWYAPVLRSRFPRGIKIHGVKYQLDKLPCLSRDVTTFTITAGRKDIGLGSAFAIEGFLKLSAITPPFRIFNGAMGKKYMLHLQGYLISPDGRVVWEQQGFPQGGAWVNANGATVKFVLIDAYPGPTKAYRVLVLAAGDPILLDYSETRVVLGIKETVLD